MSIAAAPRFKSPTLWRWLALAVVGCAVVLYGGYGVVAGGPAQRLGREQAQADIHAGRLRITVVPDHFAWKGVAWRLLRERYGLEVDTMNPALLSVQQAHDWNVERDAYNQTVIAEMQRRYGKDVFARTEREAREQTGDWSH